MGITTVTYDIHDLAEYINWIYFFHAWGFQPRFATIADIHGCDACRAGWLASFPEADRAKAAEAMQLHKEANRMLNAIDGKYKVYLYEILGGKPYGKPVRVLEGEGKVVKMHYVDPSMSMVSYSYFPSSF